MTIKYLLFPFFCTLFACLVLARLAPWLSLMDKPDARKCHGRDVPVVGGIAILLSYVVALKLRGIGGNMVEAIPAVGLMLAIGVVDDIRPVSAKLKLALQFVAAWLLCRTTGFDLEILPLPGFSDGLALGPLASPITLLAIVAVLNAINMSDGADGLAGGYVMGGLLLFLTIALIDGREISVLLVGGLMSAIGGFLVCNARHPLVPRARVFMGDAGALTLGVLLCWLGIHMTRGPVPMMPKVMIFYAAALPLLDMVTVAVRRALQGVNPMRPDRTHLHHILCLKGWSVELSVPALWCLHCLLAGSGYLLWRMGVAEGWLWVLLLGMLAVKMLCMRVWEEVEDPSRLPLAATDDAPGS